MNSPELWIPILYIIGSKVNLQLHEHAQLVFYGMKALSKLSLFNLISGFLFPTFLILRTKTFLVLTLDSQVTSLEIDYQHAKLKDYANL